LRPIESAREEKGRPHLCLPHGGEARPCISCLMIEKGRKKIYSFLCRKMEKDHRSRLPRRRREAFRATTGRPGSTLFPMFHGGLGTRESPLHREVQRKEKKKGRKHAAGNILIAHRGARGARGKSGSSAGKKGTLGGKPASGRGKKKGGVCECQPGKKGEVS